MRQVFLQSVKAYIILKYNGNLLQTAKAFFNYKLRQFFLPSAIVCYNKVQMNKRSKFLKKQCCCVGGRV